MTQHIENAQLMAAREEQNRLEIETQLKGKRLLVLDNHERAVRSFSPKMKKLYGITELFCEKEVGMMADNLEELLQTWQIDLVLVHFQLPEELTYLHDLALKGYAVGLLCSHNKNNEEYLQAVRSLETDVYTVSRMMAENHEYLATAFSAMSEFYQRKKID